MAKWANNEWHQGAIDDRNMVHKPPHYNEGTIECIEYIQDFLNKEEYIGYLRGNIAKYQHRWRCKGGVQDLNKSRWYLDRLISEVETDQ